jgi:LPPG:FO 2-phospho-L-lactate transferase
MENSPLGLETNPHCLTVIVNVGDDFEHFGLKICPDLDTVCYTLAGLANPATGWGRVDESWQALEVINGLGGPNWFRLGDRDLGLHLERTRRIREGQPLSAITSDFCRSWGIRAHILPVTDMLVPTWVETAEGRLSFQEYFVHRRCEPAVNSFCFEGVESALPAPGVLESLEEADIVVICPSNPWVSVDPILAIQGVREAIRACRSRGCPVLAVSPILGGQTVKGPAAKMYLELGIEPSALAVGRHYQGLLSDLAIDVKDRELAGEIAGLGIRPLPTQILMLDEADRKRLALELLTLVRPGWRLER